MPTPHQLIYITTHTSNQPIPMAYGISLSEEQEEEQQTHPIYTALRTAIEQGTTTPSKSIEVLLRGSDTYTLYTF